MSRSFGFGVNLFIQYVSLCFYFIFLCSFLRLISTAFVINTQAYASIPNALQKYMWYGRRDKFGNGGYI
jgi:hypothetical protein